MCHLQDASNCWYYLVTIPVKAAVIFTYFSAKRNILGLSVFNLPTLESEKCAQLAKEGFL